MSLKRSRWTWIGALEDRVSELANGLRTAGHAFVAPTEYKLGLVPYRTREWAKAREHFLRSVETSPAHASSHFKLGMCYMRERKFNKAKESMENAMALAPSRTQWKHQYSQVLRHLGVQSQRTLLTQKREVQEKLARTPDRAELHVRLAKILRSQEESRWEIEALNRAIELGDRSTSTRHQLAGAYETMRRYQTAAKTYQEAIDLEGAQAPAAWHYRMGFCHGREGYDGPARPEAMAAAYEQAIAKDTLLSADRFGIGVFHQQARFWREAALAYDARSITSPMDAELLYRLGFAWERCYEWENAEEAFTKALSLAVEKPEWHYRLGFVQERQGKYREAARAYQYAALTRPQHTALWFYRWGYCLAEAGEYASAVQAFLRMSQQPELEGSPAPLEGQGEPGTPLPCGSLDEYRKVFLTEHLTRAAQQCLQRDGTLANPWFRLGTAQERLGQWQQACESYQLALARSDNHAPSWIFRVGYVLSQMGHYRKACDAFRKFTRYPLPEGVLESTHAKTAHQKMISQYLTLRQTCPIAEDVVLYESWQGKKLGCNPYALFLYLLREPRFQKLLHVLVLEDSLKAPEWIKRHPNVVLAKRGSYLYLYYLACARYLVNNTAFPLYFIRREEQKYLITWHGTPQKTLGKHEHTTTFKRVNPAKNLNQATHFISPNSFSTLKIIDGYDVLSSHTAKVAETGYPRIDLTLGTDRPSLRRALGIDDGEYVVLYAPTWRGEFEHAQIGGQEGELLKRLAKLKVRVLFRGHHLTQKLFETVEMPSVLVPSDVYDTNELLAIADVLITDYSSVYFDYLVLGRPIIHYVYDIDGYERERGLYFGADQMPGDVCLDPDAVVDRLLDLMSPDHVFAPSERYEAARTRFVYKEDGNASARVAAFLFEDDDTDVVELRRPGRKSILIFPGHLKNNGITKSFEALLKAIDREVYDVTIAIDRDRLYEAEEGIQLLLKLQKSFTVLGWEKGLPHTLSQRYLFAQPRRARDQFGERARWEYAEAMRTDFRRIFGFKSWDIGINFGGYSPYWSNLFAHSDLIRRKVIYVHNDILEEHRDKYPALSAVVATYRHHDCCAFVSRSLKDACFPELSAAFGVTSGQVCHVDNFVDFDDVRQRAEQPISAEDDEPYRGLGFRYIAVGRLSPEKNHEMLLDAFRRVVEVRPKSRLVILGDGPLREHLKERIETLRLQGRAFLLGFRQNPYPFIRRSDCMVLVSNYEGQGLVLLEALALGTRCMATDVPGPRSVLAENRGLLVANERDAVIRGMIRMQEEKPSFTPFDEMGYVKSSLEAFYSKVCGGST